MCDMTPRAHPVIAVALLATFIITLTLNAQMLVNIETVIVGDPGNAADTRTNKGALGFGRVDYAFSIGKYEVTLNQYTTFLNSVAKTNTNLFIVNLWNTNMRLINDAIGQTIVRTGSLGNYNYSVSGNGNRPVAFVSWLDSARFCNWLHNGATDVSSTETGAYTLNGATNGIFIANADALWRLPTEDEWYKAAYYKGGGTNAGFWVYATRSDVLPAAEPNPPGGVNSANFNGVRPSGAKLTEVGAYSLSPGPYGTYDQGGNLYEWNDNVFTNTSFTSTNVSYIGRGIRGGTYFIAPSGMQSFLRTNMHPHFDNSYTGFRVVRLLGATNDPIRITSVSYTNQNFFISWQSDFPVNVQRRDSLSNGDWQTLSTSDASGRYNDTSPPSNRSFYRLFKP
jgi:sulfatase modifying factor 1